MNKTMKKLLSFCMSLAMLIGSAVTFTVNAAVSGDFNFKFIFHDVDNNDKVISEKNLTVNGTEGEQVIADVSSIMPTGYVVDGNYTQSTKISVTPYFDGSNVQEVYVKKEVKPTTLNITFETVYGEVVGTKTVSTTATGADGEAWTFMLGEDYQLPEGYKLAEGVEQTTNVTIPFGAMGGHTLIVEKINKEEPVTPVDPEEPVNPTDPEKPGTDDTKKEETKSDESIKTEVKDDKANTSNKKEEAKAKEDKKSPKTGDNTQVAGYAVTLVACIALIAYYFKKMVVSK